MYNSYQNPRESFGDTDRLILYLILKVTSPRIVIRFWQKKNEVGEISIPNIKENYIVTVVKAVRYW